jgi:probable HAF family extracellular repeat protein
MRDRVSLHISFLLILLAAVPGEARAGGSTFYDLGNLGGTYVGVYDANGGNAVGQARTRNGEYHAFLARAGEQMQDLGVLDSAYPASWATGLSGSYVVGTSYLLAGSQLHYHAFLYQIGGTEPMQDLGTLGGVYSQGYAVSGDYVVGWAAASPGMQYPFR